MTLSLLTIAASGIIEVFSPPGIYAGCGYTIAIMLTLYSKSKRTTILTAVGAAAVILISAFFLHPREDVYIASINHVFSLTGVVIAMFIVMYVKEIQEKAEHDNKQMVSLFNNATEGIILTNHSGTIVMGNPHANSLFGYSADELIGQKMEILLPESVRSLHVKERNKFNEAPVNRPMGAGRDLYAKRKDGSVFPVEISLSHFRIGKETYVVAFIIDITIRKESEKILLQQQEKLEAVSREVRKLNMDLEQKVEDRTMMLRETLVQLEKSKEELAIALEKEKELSDLKSRFVSTVSHEFRTPLSTILSSAALLGKYTTTEDQPKRERHVGRIKENVKHMNAMLEDLLSLGKLEEGIEEVSCEVFSLHKFMLEFIDEMTESDLNNQEIVYEEIGEEMVNTDKRLLRNILTNLVSNAMKFSPENSVIYIHVESKNAKVTISVKDSGIGISESDRQNLFERFFRARNAANIPGTGLGLHIISKYLELLGGTITLQSEIGKGSVFTISIPNEKQIA